MSSFFTEKCCCCCPDWIQDIIEEQLDEQWGYHFAVSILSCADWIFAVAMLIEMLDFDSIAWFWTQLIVIIISRFVCSFFPFTLYTSKSKREKKFGLCWRFYSFIMLFFFAPFHSLYHAGFTNDYLLQLVRLRERQDYRDLNFVNFHHSKFQDWVNNGVKIHIFHAYPHVLGQSIPCSIIYYALILHEKLTWNNAPIIYCAFFINLLTIMICAPIWTSRFYYSLAIGRDHYHIQTFIFIIFASLMDFIGFLYILAYLIQLNYDKFFISVTETVFNPSYDGTNHDMLVYAIWYYEFMFICCMAVICGLFLGFVSAGYLLWDVFKQMNSFKCTEICGGCLTVAWTILVSPIAVIQIILWLINALITLQLYCLNWISFAVQNMTKRFGHCSQPNFWGDMIFWIKAYKDKNDLIIRISCCNYHLQPELKQTIEKGIISKLYQDTEYELGFRDIRINSHLTDFSWFQYINNFFENVASLPEIISICFRICILIFGIPYICSRIVVLFLPLIGFIMSHFNDWGNFLTLISVIYIVMLVFVLYLINSVLCHLWIVMHICPGKKRIDSIGLHDTCMPGTDTLYACEISYQCIQQTLKYKRTLKNVLCSEIENQSNSFNQHDNDYIYYAPLKIVCIIIRYLPNNSIYVDYPKVGITDNLEKPLLESVSTEKYLNIGTI